MSALSWHTMERVRSDQPRRVLDRARSLGLEADWGRSLSELVTFVAVMCSQEQWTAIQATTREVSTDHD